MCKPVRVFTHYSLCLVIVCKGNYYVKGGCIVVEWIISQSIEWEVTVYFKSRREYSLEACAQTKGLIKTVRATAARGFKYSENGPRWKLGWCNHIVWLMQLYGVADATIWPTWPQLLMQPYSVADATIWCGWCNNMADVTRLLMQQHGRRLHPIVGASPRDVWTCSVFFQPSASEHAPLMRLRITKLNQIFTWANHLGSR